MTYTADSPIIHPGSVPAEAIDAWLAHKAQQYADWGFSPARRMVPLWPESIGRYCVEHEAAWGPSREITAAQFVHEAAGGQSLIFLDKHNPAGLGAVNNNAYGGAVQFITRAEGIRAQAAHLCVYAIGDGPWTEYDPRYAAVQAKRWLGSAPTLGGLNGKWAWPGDGYGQSIAELANDLVAFAAGRTFPVIPPCPIPIRFAYIPWSNANRDGGLITPTGITWHDTGNTDAGANAEMHRRFAWNGGGREGVSYHATVDDREAVLLLPLNERAYHALEPCNSQRLSVEVCVNSDGNWSRTLTNAARFGAWLELLTGLRDHGQHYHCTGKDCPHRLRADGGWNAFLGAIAVAREHVGPAPSPADPRHEDVEIPGVGTIRVYGGIYQEWKRAGGIAGMGYPITAEAWDPLYNARVQWFQRGRAEWRPGQWSERHDVTWGLVGDELVVALARIADLEAHIAELEARP